MNTLRAQGLCINADGTPLLSDCSCALDSGSMLAICGPNGAGKSTLLRALAGLLSATAGNILYDEQPLTHLSPRDRATRIGYLAQLPDVAWPITVRELVALGRFPYLGEPSARASIAIDEALQKTGLQALARRCVQSLSGGERTRVHLARLLAGQHRFILADEPTAALDPNYQLEVLSLLRILAREGTGIALVLHELPMAARFCDRILVLDGGRVVASGAPSEVLTETLLADVFGIRGVWDPASGALLGFDALAR